MATKKNVKFEIRRRKLNPLEEWKASEIFIKNDAVTLVDVLSHATIESEPLIRILAGSTSQYRKEVAICYKELCHKDLLKECNEKLNRGLFHQLVCGVLMPLPEFYARQIHGTFGFWTNDWGSLIDIFASIEPALLSEINRTYLHIYSMSIESDIKCHTSCGYFQRLLILLALNRRSQDEEVDEDFMKQDVRDLFEKGEGKVGTDDALFVDVLTLRSKAHLRRLFQEYEAYAGNGIRTAIKREFSFGLRKALQRLVDIVEDLDGTLAEKLYRCMAGLGTDNKQLVRLAVTLADSPRLPNIKLIYQLKYSNTLEESITDDTSGDFQKFLLALFSTNKKRRMPQPINDQQKIQSSSSKNTDEAHQHATTNSLGTQPISEVII